MPGLVVYPYRIGLVIARLLVWLWPGHCWVIPLGCTPRHLYIYLPDWKSTSLHFLFRVRIRCDIVWRSDN